MDGAFGESSCVSDCAHTRADRAPFVSCGVTIKIQVDDKGSRFLVVPDQIAHQHVEHVIVDGNGLFEASHRERMKEELRRMK